MDTDSDLRESEMHEHGENCYENHKNVKVSDQSFTCPYFSMKRKRDYLCVDPLQHDFELGNSSSEKKSAKQKANHFEKDVPINDGSGGSSKLGGVGEHVTVNSYYDEKFVWPWIGIVVNIPIKQNKNWQFVGEISNSVLKSELTWRGFNPVQVEDVWDCNLGHLGTALVKFRKDCLLGYRDAMSFERAYEEDHHGKKDWYAESNDRIKSGLFAWIAREDDYYLDNKVGQCLREIGNLKTVSELTENECRIRDIIISHFTSFIDKSSRQLKEMELKYGGSTTISLNKSMDEKDKLGRAYNEEIRKYMLKARDQLQNISNEYEQLEAELPRKESEIEERQKNDPIHQRILELEKELEAKKALELEVEQLRGRVNVMRHMGGTDYNIEDQLVEKEQDLADLQVLCQALSTQLHIITDEQVEARKVLINGWPSMSARAHFGIKRMGELESKPFLNEMKRKYSKEEAETRALELCSLWQEHLKDPNWYPFKVIHVEGEAKEIIDDGDEKLKTLIMEFSHEVYKAVTMALIEINEYNPSARFVVPEIWNFKEGRRATLAEGITFILGKLRAKNPRR